METWLLALFTHNRFQHTCVSERQPWNIQVRNYKHRNADKHSSSLGSLDMSGLFMLPWLQSSGAGICKHRHPIINSKCHSHPFCTFMRNCVPKIVKISRIGISEWGLKSYIDLSSCLFEDYTVLHAYVYLHLPSSPPTFVQLTIHIYPLKTSPYLHCTSISCLSPLLWPFLSGLMHSAS